MNINNLPDWLRPECERLFGLIERDQLPHALLVHGPAGTGRRWLALTLAGRLLGFDAINDAAVTRPGAFIDEEALPPHPDLAMVQVLPDKRDILIEQVRNLIEFLALTSHQSGYKVALLNPAHAMNRHTANSLLKTLEEPPGRSVIMLVTDALSRLPPTIVSRCQRVRVALPAEAQGAAWLAARDPAVDWGPVLRLAAGAPLRALAYHDAGAPGKVATFARDIAALRQRRTSPAAVAQRWVRVDHELWLDWLYRHTAAEIEAASCAAPDGKWPDRRTSDLQIGTENLNIERAFADLRQIGELRHRQRSGLNAELQLSAILTRWYGQG